MIDGEHHVLVETRLGWVRGLLQYVDGRAIGVFFGIPYAEPPVGDLRWQPPVLRNTPWEGVLDATQQPAICPQIPGSPDLIGRKMSEDCLTLDVWMPLGRSSSSVVVGGGGVGADAAAGPQDAVAQRSMPVMMWIHGGAFVGGASLAYGNGNFSSMAVRENLVVVSVNYRIGALGFFASDLLKPVDPHNDRGTYGLLDQRAALVWTRDHIDAFGGLPHHVTLHGQSAGAISTCLQLVSPLNAVGEQPCLPASSSSVSSADSAASGGGGGGGPSQVAFQPSRLFLRGSMASGYCDVLPALNNSADANLVEKLQCSTLGCLLSKTAEEITYAAGYSLLSFQPVRDTRMLPDQPITLLAEWAVRGAKRCPTSADPIQSAAEANGAVGGDGTDQASGASPADGVPAPGKRSIGAPAAWNRQRLPTGNNVKSPYGGADPFSASLSAERPHHLQVIQGNVNQEGSTILQAVFPTSTIYPSVPSFNEMVYVLASLSDPTDLAFFTDDLLPFYDGHDPQLDFVQSINDAEICISHNDLVYWSYITDDVFAYYFNADPVSALYNYTFADAFHTSEEFFLDDLAVPPYVLYLTPEQHDLARQMQRLWGAFVRHGKPKAAHTPCWPSFNNATRQLYLSLQTPVADSANVGPQANTRQTEKSRALSSSSSSLSWCSSYSSFPVPFELLNDHGAYVYATRCRQYNAIRAAHYGVPALQPERYLAQHLSS